MFEKEPEFGYCHALTVDEAVTWMTGCEGHEQNFDEVLKQGEMRFGEVMAVIQSPATPKERKKALRRLKARSIEQKQPRIQAMRWYTELNVAADELAQGKKHPTLVLCSTKYADGLPRFTIPSLHQWSITKGIIIPEWDLPYLEAAVAVEVPIGSQSQHPLAANLCSEIEGNTNSASESGLFSLPPPARQGNRDIVSHKGILITVYILAHALASLIDQLAEQERIKYPGDKLLTNDDDSIHPEALSQYIATMLNLSHGSEEDTHYTDSTQVTVSNVVTESTLAAVALAFAALADQARREDWIRFRNIHGEKDDRPFKNPGDVYVSNRIYDYLARNRLIPTTPPIKDDTGRIQPTKPIRGQSRSSIGHRLNAVKEYVQSDGSPAISQSHLYRSLVDVQETYQRTVS
jgi:hypothetical protein